MSSSSGAMSGLGITFSPDPPPTTHRIRHTVSYDVGLNRVAWDNHLNAARNRRESEAMIRLESDESAQHGGRRVRIAEGEPEVFGGRYQDSKSTNFHHHPEFSPLSDFDTTSSSADSANDFSPTSMSSLPSSHGSVSAYDPYHNRLAKSMGALNYREGGVAVAPDMETAQSRRYPSPIDVVIPVHYDHHLPPSAYPPPPSPPAALQQLQPRLQEPPPTPSRLPAFLQQRLRSNRSGGGLARPQSMFELAKVHASQSHDFKPPPQHIETSRHYLPPSSYDYVPQQSDEEGSYHMGVESPESIPSSAGGLQRRYIDQQYQRHAQLMRERERDRYEREEEVVERNNEVTLKSTPSTLERQNGMRSRSRSRSQSRPLSVGEGSLSLRSIPSMKGLRETSGMTVPEGGRRGEMTDPQSKKGQEVAQEDDEEFGEDEDEAGDLPGNRRGSIFSAVSSAQETSQGGGLTRQSTLLTAGANPVRRSKELDRLLAPSNLKKVSSSSQLLAPIEHSPTPSASASASASASGAASTSASSGVVSSHQRSVSQVSSRPTNASPAGLVGVAPVILEQAKSSSKARVELDLMLESELVVEGGTLRGRVEIRVRKPKDKEKEVWLTKPKIRVVGFEELLVHEARHIFYHHASVVSTLDSPAGPPSPLPCFNSNADEEGFQKGLPGQHIVPFGMRLPIAKGAKGGWKGKQGVVRYIVIASIKLKSDKGTDRSIAHFYRHVDIFPYLNPAIILAPALKPLLATASKSLFMGGSGKVELTARIHRGTWVAGQRCYVDVNVDNQSSKKIKTLTLSLIRITTIFRPRPYFGAGAGVADVDGETCQTQTTKKKVAEATLEMGKKMNKGVTAKGSWLGVEAHESGDFSHYLLVPTDALSIVRGRYLEVTYELKVSVGGSLSTDVSADIPIRVVNFVSLDPPPGHVPDSAPSTLQSHSLAKSWSIDQLRPEVKSRAGAIRTEETQPMARMASLDSLRLSELNGGRGPSRLGRPALSRVVSLDSFRTADLSRAGSIAQPAHASTAPLFSAPELLEANREKGEALVGRAKERQLNHQMSLDCISSAIASATARRQQGHQRTESALKVEVEPLSAEVEEWEPEGEQEIIPPAQELYYGGGGERMYVDNSYLFGSYPDNEARVELDDFEDVPDNLEYSPRRAPPQRELDLGDDSEDELNAMIGQSQVDEEDEGISHPVVSLRRPPSVVFRPSTVTAVSPNPARSQPSSPTKAASEVPKSPAKPFAFATPASPVRASAPILPQPPVAEVPRAARPLPPRPLALKPSTTKLAVKEATPSSPVSRPLPHQPSTASLRRGSATVNKRPSTRELRSNKVSPTFSTHSNPSDAPELDSSSAKSSPELDGAPTPPMSSPPLVHTSHYDQESYLPPTSQRKSKSPTLVSTRSRSDLRRAAVTSAPPLPRQKAVIPPSVRSKVAALESRQQALRGFAAGTISSRAMDRTNSASESESSFMMDRGRAESIVSFQAPILRREQHREV